MFDKRLKIVRILRLIEENLAVKEQKTNDLRSRYKMKVTHASSVECVIRSFF